LSNEGKKPAKKARIPVEETTKEQKACPYQKEELFAGDLDKRVVHQNGREGLLEALGGAAMREGGEKENCNRLSIVKGISKGAEGANWGDVLCGG